MVKRLLNLNRWRIAVWLTFAVGLLLAVAAFNTVSDMRKHEAELAFEHTAAVRVAEIGRQVYSEIEVVNSIAAFYHSSSFVDRREFNSFVRSFFHRYPGFKALEWVPRVDDADRPAFEQSARADGYDDFRFRELDSQGNVGPASRRDEYFPVFYVEPFTGNERALGLDLGSNPVRLAALQAARDSGELTASERITLVQETAQEFAVLLFAPVYRGGERPESLESKRENLAGFALGVLRIDNVAEAIMAAAIESPILTDIYVFDEDAEPDRQLLFVRRAGAAADTRPVLNLAEAKRGVSHYITMDVGGRNWTVLARLSAEDASSRYSWSPLAASVVVLLFMGGLAGFLVSSANRALKTESLVELRTAELKEINTRLAGRAEERRVAQAALAEREGRTRAIVDTVLDGIITIDESGDIETFNPAACRTFGYQANEVIGRNVKILMPEPYRAEHDGYLQNYLTTGDPKVIGIGREVVGRRSDGSTFPMELAVAPMKVAGRTMFTGVVRDISERKRIENMKNEFVSTVSHELRTPLTSIKGALGLLRGSVLAELPENAARMVEIAYQNSDRLVRLINDILDIEKIEAGMTKYDFAPVAVGELLAEAVNANKGFADEYGVSLVLHDDTAAAKVSADHDRMMQVVTNLLSNAIKFSPDAGEVALSAREEGGRIRISVVDSGPGIPEEFRESIFSKFAQADSSDTREKGGTGLGLAISKAIVEQHGGTIGFDTECGKGTTFHFELSACEAKAGQSTATASETRATREFRRRILVCEDDKDIAATIAMMIESSGFECDIAYSAQQAKSLLAACGYAAMTLDLALPDQNGLSLIREIRENHATRDLPVIVVSASSRETAAELQPGGVNGALEIADWLPKPVDEEALKFALERMLGKGGKKRARILHVEDDEDVVSVVSALVHDAADITRAASLKEAVRHIHGQAFDLIILDLMLPDGSGEDLISELHRSKNYRVPVIVFSAREPSADISHRIEATLVKSQVSNEILCDVIRSAI